MSKTISIDGRMIGPDQPPYIICELSGNHNGSLDRALQLIEAAATTGCDAIKLQTYTADTITIDHDGPGFRLEGGLWDGRTLYDLYAEAHTPFEWHEAMFAKAKECGVTLFSTPFDETAADLLDDLGAPAYKIASFEIVDLPLIAYVARKGKPMIISTGIANLKEIEAAVTVARDNGCDELIVLHCISSYPAPTDQSNILTIPDLAKKFDVVSGLSDHTLGVATSVASIAVGGRVIEKHFTLARSDGGPDADFSLEPNEFSRLCRECRDAWLSLGSAHYDLKGAEQGNVSIRRSLYAVADIEDGEVLSPENVRSIRPGFGLPPAHRDGVMGCRAVGPIKRGTPISWELIGKNS